MTRANIDFSSSHRAIGTPPQDPQVTTMNGDRTLSENNISLVEVVDSVYGVSDRDA